MKVLAYSIKDFERQLLVEANKNVHEIRYSNSRLNINSANEAAGFNAVVVFTSDDVSAPVLRQLHQLGVRYIATRSVGTDHIDMEEAARLGMPVMNVPAYSPQAVAEQAVALALALGRKLVPTYDNCRKFDFRIEGHMGFNFCGKTVGIVGLGHIGQAVSAIFKGMGCRVLGHDLIRAELPGITEVDLEDILNESDIISLHVPLTAVTHHLVNRALLEKMKPGVMLINTSRGAVLNTVDVLAALADGILGYLGLDVYEFEKGLFFEDHRNDPVKDDLLGRLMSYPNVLITPHQGFLTREAVQQIALSTINNLSIDADY